MAVCAGGKGDNALECERPVSSGRVAVRARKPGGPRGASADLSKTQFKAANVLHPTP